MLAVRSRQTEVSRVGKAPAKAQASGNRSGHANPLWDRLATGRPSPIQAKLTVNQPGDKYEQEAERVAEQITRTSAPSVLGGATGIQRACACEGSASPCDKCKDEQEQTVQRMPSDAQPAGAAPQVVEDLTSSPGKPLDPATRAFMEPHFGCDFSATRIHADPQGAEASRSIHARAFTAGDHIAFAPGEYAPATPAGRRLLAHELTHVVQQGRHGQSVQRDLLDDAKKLAEEKAEEFAKAQLGNLASKPLGPPSGFKGDPKCGPNFCQPFASKPGAVADLVWAGPLILAGIAKKVNTRVLPLWASYLSGGSAPKNLTADFGADFTASPTTAATTSFLVGELRKDIEGNQAALMGGAAATSLDFTPRLSSARAAIDDPKGPNQMNFNMPSDIAGNIAGGIGKDETSFPIGAKPSPFNDAREATIRATLTRNPDGSLTVVPGIRYTVHDTIDLCPGDCGAPAEMVATIPLSRFEATGLAGDVPLIVEFDAPASGLAPFNVAAPAPPSPAPVSGTVTASMLHIRSTPDTSSSIVGDYPKGTSIVVLCQTTGTVVEGNNVWFQTDRGYVSSRYVTLSGGVTPSNC
jgi:hypothetical protein